MQKETLIEKINSLPPERVAEVEDFVYFLAQREAAVSRHKAIAAYAAEHAGSDADLDLELEAATLEHLSGEEGEGR
jgi:hypothetical protein